MSYKNSSVINRLLSAQNSEEDPSSSRDVLSAAQAAESAPIVGAFDHSDTQTSEADGVVASSPRASGFGKGTLGKKKSAGHLKTSRSVTIQPPIQPSTPSFVALEVPVISQEDQPEEISFQLPAAFLRPSALDEGVSRNHPEPALLDFNRRTSFPSTQEALRPLDFEFLPAIDLVTAERPASLYVCIRSFGCDPTGPDGKSDISFSTARALVVALIAARRDASSIHTLSPVMLLGLMRFCHVDVKDGSAEGARKSLAKFTEHFLPTMLSVATMDASRLQATPVFGLWAFTAILGGRILANVKKERLVSILQLAQQQSLLQGLAEPAIVRPWTAWSCPEQRVLQQLTVPALNAIMWMTDLTADDDECKESLIRQIISFRGPVVDNTALAPATVEMLFNRGPLLRAYLAFFGVPFDATVNLHCHQLLDLVPSRLSRAIPHRINEQQYVAPVPTATEQSIAFADEDLEEGGPTDPPFDGSFDAFGNPQYDPVDHATPLGTSDFRPWSRENPHIRAYQGLSSIPLVHNPSSHPPPPFIGTPATGFPRVHPPVSFPVDNPSPFPRPPSFPGLVTGEHPSLYDSVPVSSVDHGTPFSVFSPPHPHPFPPPPPFPTAGLPPYSTAGHSFPGAGGAAAAHARAPGTLGDATLVPPLPADPDPETRTVTIFGHGQELTLAQLQATGTDYLVHLNSSLYGIPPHHVSPKEPHVLAASAWDRTSVLGFRYLVRSTPRIVSRDAHLHLRLEWWPVVGRQQQLQIVLAVEREGHTQWAEYRVDPSGSHAAIRTSGNPRWFPPDGDLRAGDLVVAAASQTSPPTSRGGPPPGPVRTPIPPGYSVFPSNGHDTAISNMLETQASLKRSGAKGTSCVSDETRTSKLPAVLSRDPVAAGKQSFRDIQVVMNLSNTNGAASTQSSMKDIVGLAKGFHGVELHNFTPLTVTKSAECARLRVRQILTHLSDSLYMGPREYLLNNNPSRWQASMEQVFLTFSTIFLVFPEITSGLFGVAARAAAMIRNLSDWRHDDLAVIFANVFDQLDDLLLRVGYDILSAPVFVTALGGVPLWPPGSTLFNIYQAIQVVAHKAWAGGTASHEERTAILPRPKSSSRKAPPAATAGNGSQPRPRASSGFCGGYNSTEGCSVDGCVYKHSRPMTAADATRVLKICTTAGLTPTRNLRLLSVSAPPPRVQPKVTASPAPVQDSDKPAQASSKGGGKRVRINTGGARPSRIPQPDGAPRVAEAAQRAFDYAFDLWRAYTLSLQKSTDLTDLAPGRAQTRRPTQSEWIDAVLGFTAFCRLRTPTPASSSRYVYLGGVARALAASGCARQFILAATSPRVRAGFPRTSPGGTDADFPRKRRRIACTALGFPASAERASAPTEETVLEAPSVTALLTIASRVPARAPPPRTVRHNVFFRVHESGALVSRLRVYVCTTAFETVAVETDRFGQLMLSLRAPGDLNEVLASPTVREISGLRWPLQYLQGEFIYFDTQDGVDICPGATQVSVDIVHLRWAGAKSYHSREWVAAFGADASIQRTSPFPFQLGLIPVHMSPDEINRCSGHPEWFDPVLPYAPPSRTLWHLEPFNPTRQVAQCPCGLCPCHCFSVPCVCVNGSGGCRCDWMGLPATLRPFARQLRMSYSPQTPLGAIVIRGCAARVYLLWTPEHQLGVYANAAHEYEADGGRHHRDLADEEVFLLGDHVLDYDGLPFVASLTNTTSSNVRLYCHPELPYTIDGTPTSTLISHGPFVNDLFEDNNAELRPSSTGLLSDHASIVGAWCIHPCIRHNSQIGVSYGGEFFVNRERDLSPTLFARAARFYGIRPDGTYDGSDVSSPASQPPSSPDVGSHSDIPGVGAMFDERFVDPIHLTGLFGDPTGSDPSAALETHPSPGPGTTPSTADLADQLHWRTFWSSAIKVWQCAGVDQRLALDDASSTEPPRPTPPPAVIEGPPRTWILADVLADAPVPVDPEDRAVYDALLHMRPLTRHDWVQALSEAQHPPIAHTHPVVVHTDASVHAPTGATDGRADSPRAITWHYADDVAPQDPLTAEPVRPYIRQVPTLWSTPTQRTDPELLRAGDNGLGHARPHCRFHPHPGCVRGTACNFLHDGILSVRVVNNFPGHSRPHCRFHPHPGCVRGTSCNFRHDGVLDARDLRMQATASAAPSFWETPTPPVEEADNDVDMDVGVDDDEPPELVDDSDYPAVSHADFLSRTRGGAKRDRSGSANASGPGWTGFHSIDRPDPDVGFLHPPHTLPVGSGPHNGDCAPFMCLAMAWTLCLSFPDHFDSDQLPASIASLRLMAVQLLVQALETTFDQDTGTYIASDPFAAMFFEDPEGTDSVGAIPRKQLRRQRRELASEHRARLALLYAVCEADGPRAPVLWWGVDLAGAVLRLLVITCFRRRPGNHIEEWLTEAVPQFALISIGPLHIVCTDPAVSAHLTLTDENAQQHANFGLAFGIYRGRSHFDTVINANPYPHCGWVPEDIGDEVTMLGARIDTAQRSADDPFSAFEHQCRVLVTRFPYDFAVMAREFLWIFDNPRWDAHFHGFPVSELSVASHGWPAIFAQSHVHVPEGFLFQRSLVSRMMASDDRYGVLCVLVNENGFCAHALYSPVDPAADSRGNFRGGTVLSLMAHNHPVFPVEHTARASDVVCYFPLALLPPGLMSGDFESLGGIHEVVAREMEEVRRADTASSAHLEIPQIPRFTSANL